MLEFFNQYCMFGKVNRSMLDGCGCWVVAQEVIVLPIMRRANWSWHKATSAIRAGIMQKGYRAFCAESALIRADSRFG